MASDELQNRLQRAEQWARKNGSPRLAELLAESHAAILAQTATQHELHDARRLRNKALDSQHALELSLLTPSEELLAHLENVLETLGARLPRPVVHRILAETHQWWLRQSGRVEPKK